MARRLQLRAALYTVDAQIAQLEGRPEGALAIIATIERDAAAYQVPEGRPDLEGQLAQLQPELDELRERISAAP